MWTTVLKCYGLASLGTIKHDRLSRYSAAHWRATDLVCPSSNVPLVFEEHRLASPAKSRPITFHPIPERWSSKVIGLAHCRSLAPDCLEPQRAPSTVRAQRSQRGRLGSVPPRISNRFYCAIPSTANIR